MTDTHWPHTILLTRSAYQPQSGDSLSIPVSPCSNLSTHWPHTSSSSCPPPPPLTDWSRSKYPHITALPCTYCRTLKQLGRLMGVNLRGGGTCSSQLLASLVCTIGSAFSGISPQAQVRWLVIIQQNVTMCFSLFLTKEIWKHVKSGKVRRRTYLLVIASR